jgi:hypothetical protein
MVIDPKPKNLLQGPLRVVNVGLELFYRSLRSQGAEAVHVIWHPPAGGDPKLTSLLDRLSGRKPEE